MRRRVDKDRIERANRESHLIIEAERQDREAKTARLREQRLSVTTEIPDTNSRTALAPSRQLHNQNNPGQATN